MSDHNYIGKDGFEYEKRRKQFIKTGVGFFLPGLLGLFTLFPATGMGLIILGTLLNLRLFFLSRVKPSKKEVLSNKVRSEYAAVYTKAGMPTPPVLARGTSGMGGFNYIFDVLLLVSFIGLIFCIFSDFSRLQVIIN
jgi:hypothetical protein